MPKPPSPKPRKKPLDSQAFTCDTDATVAVAANASDTRSGKPSHNPPRSINVPLDTCSTNRANVQIDKVRLHIIWRETDTRIDTLRARVREGVDVMAASEFARWLRFSDVLDLLQEQPFPLPCRAAELKAKVEELVAECGQWFANHDRANTKPHPLIPRTELERINLQLANLAEAVSKLSPPNSETTDAAKPALHVIAGGVS